jgi:hypothetical protein
MSNDERTTEDAAFVKGWCLALGYVRREGLAFFEHSEASLAECLNCRTAIAVIEREEVIATALRVRMALGGPITTNDDIDRAAADIACQLEAKVSA